MMLFFIILSVLVVVNILLISFSINKVSKAETKKSIVIKNKNNTSVSKNIEREIVYKKAI